MASGATICQRWFSHLTQLHILALDTRPIFLLMVGNLVFQLMWIFPHLCYHKLHRTVVQNWWKDLTQYMILFRIRGSETQTLVLLQHTLSLNLIKLEIWYGWMILLERNLSLTGLDLTKLSHQQQRTHNITDLRHPQVGSKVVHYDRLKPYRLLGINLQHQWTNLNLSSQWTISPAIHHYVVHSLCFLALMQTLDWLLPLPAHLCPFCGDLQVGSHEFNHNGLILLLQCSDCWDTFCWPTNNSFRTGCTETTAALAVNDSLPFKWRVWTVFGHLKKKSNNPIASVQSPANSS